MSFQRQRILYGWMNREQLRHYLDRASPEDKDRVADITSAWTASAFRRSELFSREAGYADRVKVRDLDPSFARKANSILSENSVRNSFPKNSVSIKTVEIDSLVVFPLPIFMDTVDRLSSKIPQNPTPEWIFNFMLDPALNPPSVYENRLSNSNFLFFSESSDFRIIDVISRTVSPDDTDFAHRVVSGVPVKVLSIVLGYGLPLVTVISAGPRIVLSNGYHRLFALRSRGIKEVPVLVFDQPSKMDSAHSRSFEQLIVQARPPLFKDFFDPAMSLDLSTETDNTYIEISLGAKSFQGQMTAGQGSQQDSQETLTDYANLIRAIVQRQMGILGQKVAIEQAKKALGEGIDDSGNVASGSKEKLAALVNQYSTIEGNLSALYAKNAIARYLNGNEDLPEMLK